jgi:endothelin-converting enzyme/putative endopeptidase
MEILNKNWKTKEWRDWFIYINVKQQIRFHEEYYKIYFSFYRKFVQGAEFKVPKKISPIFLFSLGFNKFLSIEYIKNFSIKERIDFTNNLIEDLKFVFMRIIKNNDWLSPSTKKYALLKLKYLKSIVGTQDNVVDDPDIDYSNDDAIENLDRIYKWRLEKFIELDGKPFIDMPYVDWTNLKLAGRQVYIVNAFYTPQRNDIYTISIFTAAIFRSN